MNVRLLTGIAALALSASVTSNAVVRRVNNNPGAGTPYTTLSSAVTASAAGDTIYVEGSATAYVNITINKRLHIYGTGYFLNENPQTQANQSPANISLSLNAGSKGSVIQGLVLNSLNINDSFLTVQRCYIPNIIDLSSNGAAIYGDTIRHCYLSGLRTLTGTSGPCKSLMIYNNIIQGTMPVSFLPTTDGYVINNTIANSSFTATFFSQNMVYQNNILRGNFGTTLSTNVFFNNILYGALGSGTMVGSNNVTIPTGATNVFDPALTSTDGRFQLAAGSPAIGAGALNGATVDCGAFGGPAPYILSGMPAIPSIYQLTIPAQVPSGSATMNITISAASH